MALIISKDIIERDKELQHYREVSIAAKNLVKILEDFLDNKTTRSQLNKALKKVKYLMEDK